MEEKKVMEVISALQKHGFHCYETTIGGPGTLWHEGLTAGGL